MSATDPGLVEGLEALLAGELGEGDFACTEAGEWPAALWGSLEAGGWTKMALPERLGGAGLALPDLVALWQAAGARALPAPLVEHAVAQWLLVAAGLEPPAGPLTVAPARATQAAGRVTFEGVPFARHASHLVAELDDGVALLALAGARIERASNVADEPRDTVHGGRGDVVASATLPPDRPAVAALGALARAAQMAGALRAVLEMTVRYAGERQQFGRPIARFQAVQQQLAVLAEEAGAAAVAARLAATAHGSARATEAAAIAHWRAARAAGDGARIAHAVHAAIGVTREYPLQRFTRRLWSWREESGAGPHWAEWLGQRACAIGARRLWAWLADDAAWGMQG